jgi:dihydroorotase
MSKFVCLGMPLAEVVRAATEHPARALRRPDLGTFKPGSVGDATLLALEEGRFDYVDSTGSELSGRSRLAPRGVVIGGALWHRT